MKCLKFAVLAGAVALVGFGGAAHAGYDTGTFSFVITTGNTGGNGFSAVAGATPFQGTVDTASFTYKGALGFDNTAAQNAGSTGDLNSTWFASAGNAPSTYGITGYSASSSAPVVVGGTPVAHFDTLSDFIASSGSAAGFIYGSFYTINLGTLAAGTVLTVAHDDGASVYQGGVEQGTPTTGPTTVVTDNIKLASTADTILYYSRQNGTPSILEVKVPEPTTIALLGVGLLGLGLAVRRRPGRAGAATA